MYILHFLPDDMLRRTDQKAVSWVWLCQMLFQYSIFKGKGKRKSECQSSPAQSKAANGRRPEKAENSGLFAAVLL